MGELAVTEALILEFEASLAGKDPKHRGEVLSNVRKFAARALPHDTAAAVEWIKSFHEKGLSARTCNKKGDHLSQFGTWWATKTGQPNPYALAKLPRWNPDLDRRKVRRALSDEEKQQLLDGARTGYRRRLYDFMLQTGWRLGQACKLRWADVDFDNRVLVVRAETTKSRRPSTFPMTPALAQLLKERMQRALDDGDAADRVWPRRPLTETFYRDVKRAGIANADRSVDFHSLRATFCTDLQRRGVPLSMAQLLMDHGDPKITAKHYTLYELDEQRAALEKISGSLSVASATLAPVPEDEPPTEEATSTGVAHRSPSGPAVGDAAPWSTSTFTGYPPFLTIPHVADLLGVAEYKALRLVRANQLKLLASKWGKEWRVPAAKLAAAMRGEFMLRWDPPA